MVLNTHPEDRKVMAQRISERLGIPMQYMRLPTYAYRIGDLSVNRDGTIESENVELLRELKPMLIENGWLDADLDESNELISKQTDLEITGVQLDVPISELSVTQLENLFRILYTRQHLINRMLKLDEGIHIDEDVINLMETKTCDGLSDFEAMLAVAADNDYIESVSVSEGVLHIKLPFDPETPMRWADLGALTGAMIKAAKEATRVQVKIWEPCDNEKYHANAWLNRLGFGGPQHKELRHRLMHHLSGYAAFRNDERRKAHLNKLTVKRHSERLADLRTEDNNDE